MLIIPLRKCSARCSLEFFVVTNDWSPVLCVSVVKALALLCSKVVDNRVVIVIHPLSSPWYRRRRFRRHGCRSWCRGGREDCGRCLCRRNVDDVCVTKRMSLDSCLFHVEIHFVPETEICLKVYKILVFVTADKLERCTFSKIQLRSTRASVIYRFLWF